MSVMTTFSGRRIDPTKMLDDDISITDIAHHLSLVNRFGGATSRPLSVAQHSVWVAILCGARNDKVLQRQALLHDATEAYMGDVIKWLKEHDIFRGYREAERELEKKIWRKYGCPEDMLPEVEAADRLCVRYEAKMLMPRMDAPDDRNASYPPITAEEAALFEVHWWPWGWERSEQVFTAWAVELGLPLW